MCNQSREKKPVTDNHVVRYPKSEKEFYSGERLLGRPVFLGPTKKPLHTIKDVAEMLIESGIVMLEIEDKGDE